MSADYSQLADRVLVQWVDHPLSPRCGVHGLAIVRGRCSGCDADAIDAAVAWALDVRTRASTPELIERADAAVQRALAAAGAELVGPRLTVTPRSYDLNNADQATTQGEHT